MTGEEGSGEVGGCLREPRSDRQLCDVNVKPTKGRWRPVKVKFEVGGTVSCGTKDHFLYGS